ncbi:MAG: hypothetical protein RR977_01090 [Oscillospiraceae bacterium]
MSKGIEVYIDEYLSGDNCKIALEFTSFLRANSLQFAKDESACWKNKIYYWIQYNDKCVCFISIMDPDEKDNLWTVWSDDIDSDLLDESSVTDELKLIAWDHVDHCGSCDSCSGGRHKIIFGKEFNDVCGCTFRFDNPTENDLKFMKKMIEIQCRKEISST